jgi:quinol-cytochrome oxidoreductase complex cytochrome b subunit
MPNPPLLEGKKSLEKRHETLLQERRGRVQKLPQVGDYREIPNPQPVNRFAYWLLGLAGVAIVGLLSLAWYLAGSVVQLALEGSKREERLLDVIENMAEETAGGGMDYTALLIILFILCLCFIPAIITAMKGK